MRPIIHLALLLTATAAMQLSAAEAWVVPEADAAKVNPVAVTPESVAAGKALYTQHCVDCHGETGAGDGDGAMLLGIELLPLTDPKVVAESDGALFYKTAIGRESMPGYIKAENLTEEQIWHLVNYMRSLAAAQAK